MIDYIHSNLFNTGSIRKDIAMHYELEPGIIKQITNKDIVSNTFSLNESGFNGDELKFGSIVSNKMAFKIFNTVEDRLLGKELDVKEVLNRYYEDPFGFGKFKVINETVTADRLYRQIEAYDFLYDVVNNNYASWYESLDFPTTLKDFRDSFFEHIGIIQKNQTLVNDDMTVQKTISPTTLTGKTILSAICELNGSIGRMNRESKFSYVFLEVNPTQRIEMKKIQSGTGSYEDYDVKPISQVQIRQTSDDIGAIVGSDGNRYVVQDNFLVYGKNAAELSIVANNLLSVINGITYRPFKAKFIYGNPCYEIGDAIKVVSKNATFNSYIFERTLTGINAITDSIETKGKKEYSEQPNSTQNQFIQLERKTNELIRTVDGMESRVVEEVLVLVSENIDVGGVNLVDNSYLFGCVTLSNTDVITDSELDKLRDENKNLLFEY